jgi:hypothetical protein
MNRAHRVLLVVAIWLALAAQAAAQSSPNRAPGFDRIEPGAKVLILPPDIELFEVSGGGIFEPRADWTAAAQDHVRAAYRSRYAALGVQVLELQDDGDEAVLELNRLHGAVAGAISSHHFGMMPLPTKEGKLDWTLGPDVVRLREKTGADYALFTFIRDSYVSADRKAAIVIAALFGVGLASGGIQFTFNSLVDLRGGRIVWANRLLRGTGDLREAKPAQETVDAMLTGLVQQVAPPAGETRPRSIRDL